jgi:transposase InsO family protein
MIGLEDRLTRVRHIETAHAAGARLHLAERSTPAHALTDEERARILAVANAPAQVWCWDMTYLPAQIQGRWFYLYLIMDLYSRMIVGWEIHERDDAEHAVSPLKRTALAEGIHAVADKPALHGDNASTLKATTVLAMLHWLGVKPSYSRPRVCDDNAFVESLFKTAKYRPEFPVRGFATLEDARQWGRHPARWSGDTRNCTPAGPVTLNPEREAGIRHPVHPENLNRLVA